jgi:Protein of unknown function (DUF732)
MKRKHVATVASLVVSAGLMGAAAVTAAPAHAETGTEVFLNELNELGLVGIDPATALRIGESVCPMLVEPGQTVANLAAGVADALGRPLGPATMFTGLAISVFCPGAVAAIADGRSPVPLPLLGT